MLSFLALANLLFNPILCDDLDDNDSKQLPNDDFTRLRSLLDISENTMTKKSKQHLSSVEGAYKGAYAGANEDGNCLLLVNHVSTIPTNANNSSQIIASFCKSRLLILNSNYQRHTFQFWYGVYSSIEGEMILSDHNFTYNARDGNLSFVGIDAADTNGTCPHLLRLSIGESDYDILGNFTDHCAYDIRLLPRSFSFDALRVFSSKANSYGVVSLCAVSGIFYFLFKQYEYSQMMGRVVKLSFITLYFQFIYNGMICFVHFDAAMNVEFLFSTFLMISFICIMNANLYQRMMRSIWCTRWNHIDHANNIKVLNFLQILSFVFVLFLSQYIMVGGPYAYLIYAILTSDWLFQIAHNIKTGHIMSWKLSVLLTNTCCKLFFPLYLYGCPHNIAHHSTNYVFCVSLVLWQCAQILFIYVMDYKRNARFFMDALVPFIPQHMMPQHYKYHRTPNYDIDTRCAIAMDDDDDIDIDDNNNDDRKCSICLENINWKKEYKCIMVTPCNHYFHDKCLSQWMFQRLTCPTCRANIPPKSY